MSKKKVILFAFLLLTSLRTSYTSFTSDPTESKLDGHSASTEPNLQVLEPKKPLSGWIHSSEATGIEKNNFERNRFHELDATTFSHFKKEYSDLPPHNKIEFSLTLVSRETTTFSENKLHLLFDSREPETVGYANHNNYYNGYSSATEDGYPFEIQGIVTHNISSLRVELAPEFTQNIHRIIDASLRMKFILDTASTDKLSDTLPDVSSSSANNIVTTPMSESFALFQEEYHPKRNLQSIVCDNTCLTCDGAGANDCTSCSSDRYLTVLGPTVIYCAPDEYSDFGDFCEYMLLAPPDTAGKATLTVLIYIMQYLQYLDLPTMPANMERIAVGKGRSILSLLYGFQMPSKMQDSFIKYPLNEIFERRSLHSSFLVNFWPEITSFLIIIVAAIVFTFCEKIAKRYKWGKWQAAFEAVRVITRWNLCLMILATSFGNMILYASLEFRTFYISFGSSSTYASFFICLISIAFITGMFIGTIYLVRKAHNARKVSYDNYIIFAKTWQDFQVLFSGYSSRHVISRMFFLVYTIRLGLPMLVAAYIYPSPLAQAIIQLLISIAIVAIILYYKPIRRKINKIQIIMYEGLVLITNIMSLALTLVSIHHSENTDALNGLGYFVIFINFLINLLLLIFLLIKVVIAVKTILSLKNMQSTEEKIISWLQILYLPLQQGGMTFECVYQELDLVNEPIEDTSTMNSSRKNRTGHNTSYDRNNRSVDNSMMTLFDKKGNKKGRYGNQSPRSRVTPSNNITSTSNRGPGKPVSPSRINKPTPPKRNNSPYKISNDPHLQENNLTISPRYSPTRKDGVLVSGERNGMSYNEWVAARSDPNYKKPASPVANKSNVTRTPSPGNTRNQTPIKPRSPTNIRQPSPQSPSRANKSGSKSPNKIVPWR